RRPRRGHEAAYHIHMKQKWTFTTPLTCKLPTRSALAFRPPVRPIYQTRSVASKHRQPYIGRGMAKHTIVLIPGDGIGPEVTSAAKRVIEAAGLNADWIEVPAGASAVEQGFDNVLPQKTLDVIKTYKVALK